jgi:hypothetical protein
LKTIHRAAFQSHQSHKDAGGTAGPPGGPAVPQDRGRTRPEKSGGEGSARPGAGRA